MGLFEKMGREVEKFKQNAQEAAEEHKQKSEDGSGDDDDADECPVCLEAVPADATECPHCGTDLENYDDSEEIDLPTDDSESSSGE